MTTLGDVQEGAAATPLAEWLKTDGYGAVSRLSHATGVSMLTIRRVRDGYKLKDLDVAKALSAKTGVPLDSLMDLTVSTDESASQELVG